MDYTKDSPESDNYERVLALYRRCEDELRAEKLNHFITQRRETAMEKCLAKMVGSTIAGANDMNEALAELKKEGFEVKPGKCNRQTCMCNTKNYGRIEGPLTSENINAAFAEKEKKIDEQIHGLKSLAYEIDEKDFNYKHRDEIEKPVRIRQSTPVDLPDTPKKSDSKDLLLSTSTSMADESFKATDTAFLTKIKKENGVAPPWGPREFTERERFFKNRGERLMTEWKKDRDERKARKESSRANSEKLDLQQVAEDLVRAEDEGLRNRGDEISLHDESADLEIHRKYEDERKKRELRRKRFQSDAESGGRRTTW